MSVIFLLLGHLRYYVNGASSLILEEKEGKSLEAVCKEIGLPIGLGTVFVVNREQKGKEYLLQPDDEVKLIALSGGG
jgi:molybdopterin converting factor small subunit